MKSRKLQIIYLLSFCIITFFIFSSNQYGITGKSATGCGGNGCHTASNATTISLLGIPSNYVYGAVYLCTLAVTNNDPLKIKGGFDLTVNIGTVSSVAGQGTSTSGSTEIYHNSPKTSIAGNSVWTFNWTAPAGSGQTLIVKVAGNAVDGNNQPSNDAFETDLFSFNAPPGPSIANETAINITKNTATINADINANNSNTTAVIEYGITASYGSTQAMTPAAITGMNPTSATSSLSGLNASTLYHFRVKATNADGITTSPDDTFTTLNATALSDIQQSSIEVYPNPVFDYMMYLNKENNTDVQFSIVNILGETQKANVEKIAQGNYKISTNALSRGNYILIMQINEKRFVHHFTK